MNWWFSDYDGTINVHHNESLEPEDLAFMSEWVANDNKLIIASGRMNHEIIAMLEKNHLQYDYLITNNGACVYDKNNNMIEHLPISLDVRKQLMELLTEFKDQYSMAYCLENERVDLTNVYAKEIVENKFLLNYAPKENNWVRGEQDILQKPEMNLIYFYVNVEDTLKIRSAFKKIPGIKVVATLPNVLEVMDSRVSKAHGIEVIRKFHDIDVKNIYTSGDGENDIEMLEYTNNSFAMATAPEAVKKAAKHVITRVREIKKYSAI